MRTHQSRIISAPDRLWRHFAHLSWRHSVTYRRSEAEISRRRRPRYRRVGAGSLSSLPARWLPTDRRSSHGLRRPASSSRSRGHLAGMCPTSRVPRLAAYSAVMTAAASALPRSRPTGRTAVDGRRQWSRAGTERYVGRAQLVTTTGSRRCPHLYGRWWRWTGNRYHLPLKPGEDSARRSPHDFLSLLHVQRETQQIVIWLFDILAYV